MAGIQNGLRSGVVVAVMVAVATWFAMSPDVRPGTTRAEARVMGELYREVLKPRPDRRRAGLVVFLHGGGWEGGARFVKRPFTRQTAKRFARMGFRTYNVDYRSGRQGIRDAVRWFDALHYRRPNAPIFLAGSSAGAHLALEVARRRDAAGVVGIGTPTDLRAESNTPHVSRRFIRPHFRGPRVRARLSPLLHQAAIDEPVLLGHLVNDRLIPFEQAAAFQSPLAETIGLDGGGERFPHGGADAADLREFYRRVRALLL